MTLAVFLQVAGSGLAFREFQGNIPQFLKEHPEIRAMSLEFQDHVCQGVKAVTLNGETLPDNLVPADKLSGDNWVKVVLG